MTDKQSLIGLEKEAQRIVAKYEKKHAAVLPLLHLAQDAVGHVTPEVEEWVSRRTEVPIVHVREVVTFYSMFHQKPAPACRSGRGKHHIRFCTTTSCILMGAENVLDYLKKKIKVENGGCTSDGKFSLEEAECLCACEMAPMMQVDGKYYGNLDEKKVDRILEEL